MTLPDNGTSGEWTYRGKKIHRFVIVPGTFGLRWKVYYDSMGHCEYPLDGWATRKEALADFMGDSETGRR
jgi:hypothetical protein